MPDMVSADTDDLGAFVSGGSAYYRSLHGLLEELEAERRSVSDIVGGGPLASGRAPFEQLLSDVVDSNGYTEVVRTSLLEGTVVDGTTSTVAESVIESNLLAAGYDGTGDFDADSAAAWSERMLDLAWSTEVGLDADQREELDWWRSELESGRLIDPIRIDDVEDAAVRLLVANLIIEQAAAENQPIAPTVGGPHWNALTILALDVEGTDLQSFVANRFLEVGLGLEAELGQFEDPGWGPGPRRQEAAAVMTTLGLNLLTDEERIDLVAELESDRAGTQLLLNALDLDGDETNLGGWVGSGVDLPGRSQALAGLLGAAVDDNGHLLPGADELFDRMIAVLPEDVVTIAGVRGPLVAVAGAPNYGLDDDEFILALELDAVLADFPDEPTDLDFAELELLVARTGGDTESAAFILGLLQLGVPAAEALRISKSGVEGPPLYHDGRGVYYPGHARTDRRVDLLRLLVGTNPLGDPTSLEDAVDELGLPETPAASLISELRILQAIQLDRFNGDGGDIELPLSNDQFRMVADFEAGYDEIDGLRFTLFDQRYQENPWAVSGTGVPNQYQTMLAIAEGELTVDADGNPISADMIDLARRLTSDDGQAVWQILYDSQQNDRFLNPDGTYGGFDPSPDEMWPFELFDHANIAESDFTALAVQMMLLQQLGPSAHLLDGNGDGVITENDRDAWLEANEDSIPPIVADRIRFGAGFGLGHDDWGWDELAEGLGIVGLAAAVVATIVFSGGTATPLWVTGGLVTLAGAEAFAAYMAGDGLGATLAGLGAVGDVAAAARLFARGVGAVDNATDAAFILRLAGEPGVLADLDAAEQAAVVTRLVDISRASDNPELRALARRADELTPSEFAAEYARIAGGGDGRLLDEFADLDLNPAERLALRHQVEAIDGLVPAERIEQILGTDLLTPDQFALRYAGEFATDEYLAVAYREYLNGGLAEAAPALGRLDDTAAAEALGLPILNSTPWSIEINDAYLQGIIDAGRPVYLATAPGPTAFNKSPLDPHGPRSVYHREYLMLLDAGYVKRGDYLVPPGSDFNRHLPIDTTIDTETLRATNFEHALSGEIARGYINNRAVGGHYPRSPNIRIIEQSAVDANGVTIGRIEIWDDVNLVWVPKEVSNHTFFPDHWSRRQTEFKIEEAFDNATVPDPTQPHRWVGYTSDGVPIEGIYIDPDEPGLGWITAYPRYEG